MNNLGPNFSFSQDEEAKKAICFRAKCGTISIIRTELTCFSLTDSRHDDDPNAGGWPKCEIAPGGWDGTFPSKVSGFSCLPAKHSG